MFSYLYFTSAGQLMHEFWLHFWRCMFCLPMKAVYFPKIIVYLPITIFIFQIKSFISRISAFIF
ncbi:hypothetical protein WQ57_13590 [Mesobacillus campisalis]|uniref:Uncharacterized protein n=1 Tax=Mesobacillus campisalis TaxID=1408103 RepID=A0A0M2SSC0_9BACI|nr:hypothetical protein WQ57_13590 [Mesobacillus campisalis]